MQHDVFVHPIRRVRQFYPYVAILQSDYVEDEERLVAPLIVLPAKRFARSAPVVSVNAVEFRLVLMGMFAMPTRLLRQSVGSIAADRDDIVRGLDWLFTGI